MAKFFFKIIILKLINSLLVRSIIFNELNLSNILNIASPILFYKIN